MELEQIINTCNEHMQKAIDAFKKDLSGLRTGRPSPDIISPIKVEAYGAKSVVGELANITVVDARTLTVNVWDKNLVNNVDAAIRESGLGFNPVVDGTTLKIYLPPLTKERRDELIKLSSKSAEKFRIEIRNFRRDSLEEFKHIKKEASVSEDDIRLKQKKIEDFTNSYMKEIDTILQGKIKELEQI
ncbi:ribosome recycling factor [Rickettsiales bacterium LUAb2]